MNIHSIFDIIRPYFLRKRRQAFKRLINPSECDKILDVGGDHWFWLTMEQKTPITLLNLYIPEVDYNKEKFSYVLGDGKKLPYSDKEYDIAFSNSTIEHVGTFEQQQKFANEIKRTGKQYWVQTPNRWFFVEPHLVTPFFHYLSVSWQKKLMRYFTVWGLVTKPSKEQIDKFLNETRLLTRKEMKVLFPDATLYEEKFLFFTKSFVAYRISTNSDEQQQARDRDKQLENTRK